MTTKRKPLVRAPSPIPPGILRYLLDEPIDPNADNRGLLETFRQTRAELLDGYWGKLTLAQRRRAMRVMKKESEEP
jgi:hypothetical protein